MDREAVAATIAALHASEAPLAQRFDAGPPLAGRAVVLPSAFNPPTLAHLRLLSLAADAAEAPHRVALLTTRNVAKGLYGASLEDRVGMLLAVSESPRELTVVTTNVARFVDQGVAVAQLFPGVALDFVAGHDTLIRIFDPRFYDDMAAELAPFFARHRLVATNRGAAGLAEIERFLARQPATWRERVLVVELDEDAAAMSSTAAREHIAGGGAPSSLPPAVADYIARHGLYREA